MFSESVLTSKDAVGMGDTVVHVNNIDGHNVLVVKGGGRVEIKNFSEDVG